MTRNKFFTAAIFAVALFGNVQSAQAFGWNMSWYIVTPNNIVAPNN